MILALQVVALISMLTIIFIAVWSFIIANKAYSQMRYQNYLLEKLIHNVTLLKNNSNLNLSNNIHCDEDNNLSSTEYSKTHNNQSTAESSKDSEVVDHETAFESQKNTSTNM